MSDVVSVVSQTQVTCEVSETGDHRALAGKSAVDQHPTSAITGLDTALAGKVDKVTGKQLSTEDYTTAEKSKLSGIADGANNYAHPSTHSADIITDGTNNKAYTAAEKTKLAGIAAVANAYSHPNHSGDVTSVGDGATTIANDAVTNAKMANMATQTIKGRNTASTGDPEDLSVSTVKTMLSINNVDNTSDANKPISTAQQAALSNKADNSHFHVTGPNYVISDFSRASTGLLDGVEFGVNERRWNENGTLFEPAVTNLLPAGAENFVLGENYGEWQNLTDGTGSLVSANGRATLSIGNSTYSLARTFVPKSIVAGEKYTLSICLENTVSGVVSLRGYLGVGFFDKGINTFSLDGSGGIVKKSVTLTAPDTRDGIYFDVLLWSFYGVPPVTVSFAFLQVEAKAYATSYTPPGTTRAEEIMTIPASVLSADAGTLRFKFIVDDTVHNANSGWNMPFVVLSPGEKNQISLRKCIGNNEWIAIMSSESVIGSGISIGPLTNGEHVCGFVWDAAGTRLWIDGGLVGSRVVKPVTFADAHTGNVSIGSYYGEHVFNSFMSDIIIDRIARTDAEMAYTGTPIPDEYTTFFSPLKESANSRPYVIANGVAEEMLTEPGCRKTHQTIPAKLKLRAVVVDTNTIDFSCPLPNSMRGNPVFASAYAETTNWKINSIAGVQTTGFALALLNASANQLGFRATKTSHGLTDAVLEIVTDMGVTA